MLLSLVANNNGSLLRMVGVFRGLGFGHNGSLLSKWGIQGV